MSILLDKCCCLTLRTGVIIIGVLHAAGAAILMLMHLTFFISFIADRYQHGLQAHHIINVLSVVQAIITVYFAITIALIYGARKGNRYCFIPFLSVHGLYCSYLGLYGVLSCLFLVSTLVGSVVAGVIIAVNIYVLFIVISHHQELKKQSTVTREEDEISIVNNAV